MNVQNEVVKLMHAASEQALCLASHAIDAFARAAGYVDNAEERERADQPTLISIREERSEWSDLITALCSATQRAVIAVDEAWLEDHYDDEHGFSQPMAILYEVVDGLLLATEAKLHHSRSGLARLCSADLTEEYAVGDDGVAGWYGLPKAFTKRAAVGVQRAGERWFWDHDDLTTQDLVADTSELEDEAWTSGSVRLPGVVLNMGSWKRSAVRDRAA